MSGSEGFIPAFRVKKMISAIGQRVHELKREIRKLEEQKRVIKDILRRYSCRYPNRRVMVAVKQYWRRGGSGGKAAWYWRHHDERLNWRCRG